MNKPPLFLPQHRVLVAAFVMQGCGACDAYKPVFRKVVTQQIGLPLFEVKKGQLPDPVLLARTCLPVYLVDCDDPLFADWADYLKVKNTPTTYALRRPTGVIAAEGGLTEAETHTFLQRALRGLTCEFDRRS